MASLIPEKWGKEWQVGSTSDNISKYPATVEVWDFPPYITIPTGFLLISSLSWWLLGLHPSLGSSPDLRIPMSNWHVHLESNRQLKLNSPKRGSWFPWLHPQCHVPSLLISTNGSAVHPISQPRNPGLILESSFPYPDPHLTYWQSQWVLLWNSY